MIKSDGSRKMKKYLRTLGYKVGRKRVQRLMRLMRLASIAPRKRTTVPSDGHKIYPYLLRNLDIDRPNMVWASDITYIRLRGGFVYLSVVMLAWRQTGTGIAVMYCPGRFL